MIIDHLTKLNRTPIIRKEMEKSKIFQMKMKKRKNLTKIERKPNNIMHKMGNSNSIKDININLTNKIIQTTIGKILLLISTIRS